MSDDRSPVVIQRVAEQVGQALALSGFACARMLLPDADPAELSQISAIVGARLVAATLDRLIEDVDRVTAEVIAERRG